MPSYIFKALVLIYGYIFCLMCCLEVYMEDYVLWHLSLYSVVGCCRLYITGMEVKHIGKLSKAELNERLKDPLSCLQLMTVDQHVMISPKYLGKVADGIREQLDAKLKLHSEH
jgi:hypothetical protein